MSVKNNYKHTIRASYIGFVTQAIINNFAPLLFLTFQREPYNIPLGQITLLITVNFAVQLLVDFLSAKFADMIGYKPLAVAGHILCAAGLIGLAVLPGILPSTFAGLLVSVVIYATGGGLLEVLISPIVEACPTDPSKKSSNMSLLHSFYCWGLVFVVIVSTAFFMVFGIENWKILACIWAIIPLLNAFYFSRVPIATLTDKSENIPVKKLFSAKLFWILLLLMICSGASEQAMIQWASFFAEEVVKSKPVGDLAGPCLFAVLMGISRVFYSKFSEKIKLKTFMAGSGVLCIISYMLASLSPDPVISLVGCSLCGLAAGIMWPGTFSIAAETCPKGGTALFALLALGGDLGCSAGPTVVGVISETAENGIKTGILTGIIFPALLIFGLILLAGQRKSRK